METTALALYMALLSILPHSRHTPCLRAHAQQITHTIAAAEQDRHVPAGVLLVVGLLESHCGCAESDWGAPIDDAHRHTAGTSDTAAFALAVAFYGGGRRHFVGCHTWARAIGRFRSGICDPFNPVHQAYVTRALHLIERVYAAAGQPVPASLR